MNPNPFHFFMLIEVWFIKVSEFQTHFMYSRNKVKIIFQRSIKLIKNYSEILTMFCNWIISSKGFEAFGLSREM